MCDYSLGELNNRLAVEGEELVVHRFPTGSVGLASPTDLCAFEQCRSQRKRKSFWRAFQDFFALTLDLESVPAICVPPGARLTWKTYAGRLPQEWEMKEEDGDVPVRFVQTSAEVNQYRDALELPNRHQVLLQDLPEGLRLQLTSFGGDVDYEVEGLTPVSQLAR